MAEYADFYEDWRKRLNEPMTFGETLDALRRFHIDSEMRHDREMARIEASDERSRVRMDELAASHAELEASQRKTEATLRWAIRLSVEDARRQRKRNAEFDKRHTEYDKQHAEYDKQHAEYDKQHAEYNQRHAEFEQRQAERNAEFDKRQAELQELLKAFLKRGGNGNP